MSEMKIWASPEVREKNLQVYNQKKETYHFWKNLMLKFLYVQVFLFIPFLLANLLIVDIAFWVATVATLTFSAIAEYHRRQANKAAQGNW